MTHRLHVATAANVGLVAGWLVGEAIAGPEIRLQPTITKLIASLVGGTSTSLGVWLGLAPRRRWLAALILFAGIMAIGAIGLWILFARSTLD